MNFFKENIQLLKIGFIPFFGVWVLSACIDQYLGERIEAIVRSPSGPNASLIIFSFFSIISGLLFPLLMTVIAIHALALKNHKLKLLDFAGKNFQQMFIEDMRSWGQILLYSLLLIVPGVIRYIQLCFVQFIVTTSPAYDRGEQDALKFSTKLVNKNWLTILGIMLIFHILFPVFITTLFDQYKNLLVTPLQSLILSALSTYISFMGFHLLYRVYSSQMHKINTQQIISEGAV